MTREDFEKIQFASDNYSGACPEVLKALEQANKGYARSYGDDVWTKKASDALRKAFDADCEVFFVFNGTAANSLALSSLCQSYHSILCSDLAHIETDECGGPEFFSNGTKLLTLGNTNGKLNPAAIDKAVTRRTDIHYPKPRAISLTQTTEVGTAYTPEELRAISSRKKKFGLHLHLDGARFANAVASLEVHPSEISWKAGVDVLCFGGAKNGGLLGEAVVFFNKNLAREFDYRCKQAGQLASKMRFLSAPWCALLSSDVWLKNARQANSAARLLKSKIEHLPGVEVMYPCESNAVFVKLPETAAQKLKQKGWVFYNFIGTGHHRFMCGWNTTASAINKLVSDLERSLRR